MTEFSAVIDEFWGAADGFHVVVDASLPHDRRVSVLRRPTGTTVTVSPAIAELLGSPQSEDELRASLLDAQLPLHDTDNLFYFPEVAKSELTVGSGVRRLTSADAESFADFEASASEQDRDDAFVELDHWAVCGSFEGELLVAAASAYPWRDSALADIGVLTLPEYRGRGHARAVVRGLSAHIVGAGYEPQYRCQLDNAGSIAVAASAGLALFGTWEVVAPDSAA